VKSPQDTLRSLTAKYNKHFNLAEFEQLTRIADHMDAQDSQIMMMNRVSAIPIDTSNVLDRLKQIESQLRNHPTRMDLENLAMQMRNEFSGFRFGA